jgi:hypothetical protein
MLMVIGVVSALMIIIPLTKAVRFLIGDNPVPVKNTRPWYGPGSPKLGWKFPIALLIMAWGFLKYIQETDRAFEEQTRNVDPHQQFHEHMGHLT